MWKELAALGLLGLLAAPTQKASQADLILVGATVFTGDSGNLLQDFSALRRTVAVLESGRVVSGALPTR